MFWCLIIGGVEDIGIATMSNSRVLRTITLLLIMALFCPFADAKTVQWPVSEGGNGHVYEVVVVPESIMWVDAKRLAEQKGGYLATITSQDENDFVFSLINDRQYWNGSGGPLLGGYQLPGSAEPRGGWVWVTGEPFVYSNWGPGQPNNNGNENCIHFGWGGISPEWNNLEDNYTAYSMPIAYIVEYSHRNVYVDDDAAGVGDGTSWTNAYICLQNALAAARPGDEIRVAQGIYKPDQQVVISARFGTQIVASGDRTATFQLISWVTIKGGYAGFGEPDPNDRDIELYETVLSGDLNGDDANVPNPFDLGTEPTRIENSYHVVTGSGTDETAVLDGLAITAGNANGNQPHDKGGGMLNDSGSPTVENCTFTGNSARVIGGGMLNDVRSSTVVTNCTFTRNLARLDGGGMFNFSGGIPTVENCTFSGNSAKLGGGMYNDVESNATVTNCMFSANWAESHGGGMYNDVESNTTVTNCTFSDNWAESQGGGMYNLSSHPTLTNCIFSENSAEEWGGGIACIAGGLIIESCSIQNNWSESGAGISSLEDCSPEISDSTICYNIADSAVDSKGGGLFVDHSNLLVENCVFVANQASPVPPDDTRIPGTGGGAICCANGANVVVIGSTFIDNSSTDDGGAICCHKSCLQITDGTFLRNSSADAGGAIYLRESQQVDVTNSLFAGNSATYFGGAILYRDSTILNIYNCTLTNNSADIGGGIRCSVNDTVGVISNSILWDNFSPRGQQIAMIENAILQVRYCNIAGGAGDVRRGSQPVLIWGEGNMDVDPLFANPGYWVIPSSRTDGHDIWIAGDYHLKSEAGRWDPNSETWIQDDMTSPCIDAGDPNSDFSGETWPHGERINMGAYGNTRQASMSLETGGLFLPQVAYIFSDNHEDAESFEFLLEAYGCSTTLIKLEEVTATPLDSYDLIIVANDTQDILTWSDPNAVIAIEESSKPVIGLGKGAYTFFGLLGLSIGDPHGAHGSKNSIEVVDPNSSLFSTPYLIEIPEDRVLHLYTETNQVRLYLWPTIPESVTVLARQVDNPPYSSLATQYNRYLFWGFTESPQKMTEVGKKLFINVVIWAANKVWESKN